MQVIGTCGHFPDVGCFQLFGGEIKEISVVCFKFDSAIRNEDLVIAGKKFCRCQTSSCMAGFRPWIGEIQIDPGYGV